MDKVLSELVCPRAPRFKEIAYWFGQATLAIINQPGQPVPSNRLAEFE